MSFSINRTSFHIFIEFHLGVERCFIEMACAKRINNSYYLYNSQDKYVKPLGKITKEEVNKIVTEWEEKCEKPIPSGEFDIIYADPPWRFETWSEKGKGRSAEQHYTTMQLEDIKNLPVNKLAHKNCILFLWAISPMLPQALDVMESWSFRYKTSLVWVKDKVGLGYYVRARHEYLLIGAKGKGKIPAVTDKWQSVIFAPRREHSKKPDIVYDIIEGSYPDCKYLELFAREKHPGWEA